MKSKWLLIGCLLMSFYAKAQTEDNQEVQQLLESLPEEEETSDLTDVTYWLNYYSRHPLNLNTATAGELKNIPLLNPMQIASLLNHIQKHGELISIYELQAVPGWDLVTIRNILPYVTIENAANGRPSFMELWQNGEHTAAVRYNTTLEQEKGYVYSSNPARQFNGSPYGLMTRYQYNYDDRISLGITADKDPGEELNAASRGFDFYSFHAFYKENGVLNKLALGDYQLQFGQGLVMWSAFAVGKTGDVSSVARGERGIIPSRSANESQFMRGGAASLAIHKLTLTPFVSFHKIDASFSDSADRISSILLSGYHRNETELSKRHNSTMLASGLNAAFQIASFKVGFTGLYTSFGNELAPGDQPYEYYNPSGKSFLNYSVSYSGLVKNIYLFGEEASDAAGHPAFVNGALLSLHKQLSGVLLHHYYDKAYYSPYSNDFGANTANRNEHGMYAGLNYMLNAHFKASGSADMYTFPWLRYGADAPSSGVDYLLQLDYTAGKKISAYVRYTRKNKGLNGAAETQKLNPLVEDITDKVRLHLHYALSKNLQLQSRAEYVLYNEGESLQKQGFMAYQEISYKAEKLPLKISARYTAFDIEDFNARIYALEQDMPYSFSIPAFQDEGSKWHLLMQYNIGKKLRAYAKISRLSIYNKETLGTDLMELPAPHRTDIKGMVVWML